MNKKKLTEILIKQCFQSLASDKLLPYIVWFSKGYGKLNDPRRGYVLTFIISFAFIAIADFNIIANIISNCYLSSWGLVNISCFHSAYVSSSSWRPKFKYFNKWISLLCGLFCFILTFCFDWLSALCLLLLMSIIWFSIYCYIPGIDL
jgi:amino acid transporter